MVNGGQSCIAGKRFIVVREVLEAFERAMVEAMRGYALGDPREEETKLGPMQSVQARDEYVHIVPPNLDTSHHGLEYEYYAAEQYFLYGQFDVARQRFDTMWKDHCGKDEYGYRAWEKLITMSNLERNAQESIRLAERYGSAQSARFVNGVLDALARRMGRL